jgi:hypothetical protein
MRSKVLSLSKLAVLILYRSDLLVIQVYKRPSFNSLRKVALHVVEIFEDSAPLFFRARYVRILVLELLNGGPWGGH